MEISKDHLRRIVRGTRCEWTKGYVACLLDTNTPTQNEIARDIIDSFGPNNKIAAIKKIRDVYGLTLKETKVVVDEYYNTGNIVGLPFDDDDMPPAASVV